MELSIVATLYQSAPYLREFYQRLTDAAQRITDDYEIILVNDGSPDDSLSIAVDLHRQDRHVKVVDLSRNFGHHKAILAGLSYAKGSYVFLVDVDLEEEPELLAQFYTAIQGQDEVDLVYGVQETRKGGWLEREGGRFFYALFNSLSGLNLPPAPMTLRIMTRRYLDALLLHHEEGVFLAGLFEVAGFGQKQILVTKQSKGRSSYSLAKRFRLLVKGITSFSSLPLYFSFYTGAVISLAALVYAAVLVVRWVVDPQLVVEGWTSVMVSIWFLGGVILLSSGMIGIYLSQVYREVKRRPNFIVRHLYEK